MALVQPKRPAGGAFGVFANEKRPEFSKACQGQPVSAVTKMSGQEWKKLSEKEREPYQKKYEWAKAQFEKDMAAFLENGGVRSKGMMALRRERREAKELKGSKDPNKPKAPAGGAYAVFLGENRARIVASLPKDHKITDVAKAAGAEWKTLSEADKKPYEVKYEAKKEEYKKAMEQYVPPVIEKNDQATPERKPAGREKRQLSAEKPGKRAKPDKGSLSSPAKRAKKVVAPTHKEVEIDVAVLKEVETLNMVSQFQNLAARPDVKSSGKSHEDMLAALKSSEGLVNKAKALLLAGA